MQEVLKKINSNWTKDEKIRYLYVKLAPFFQRDLDYFLSDKESQLNMYKNGFKENSNLVVCKTICDQYQAIFKMYNIESIVITTNNKDVPHYALIVEGDYGWYYLDPLKDLFANQLGLKTSFFGITPDKRYSNVKSNYTFLIDLPQEYIEWLDLKLNLIPKPGSYLDIFFEELHKEITSNIANAFFGVQKNDYRRLMIEKLKFMSNTLINLGNIPGLFERNIFYNFLILCIFNRRERKQISSSIISENTTHKIELSLFQQEVKFQEYKNCKGTYYLKMTE